jgi:hypothetical protein
MIMRVITSLGLVCCCGARSAHADAEIDADECIAGWVVDDPGRRLSLEQTLRSAPMFKSRGHVFTVRSHRTRRVANMGLAQTQPRGGQVECVHRSALRL